MANDVDRRAASYGGYLVVLALGYAIFHSIGTLLAFLGDVGSTQTRWADWVDLATPYVVTGAAAGALRAAGASRRAWTWFWFATVLYTQGQGIHLAANSVGNAESHEIEPAYLWDEHVGHYLWFTGFALIVGVLAVTLSERRRVGGVGAHLLALLVGFTNFTNTVEGQTPVLGIVVAVVFVVWGWRTRDRLGQLLITAYAFSLLLFAIFGIWQGGFPEFSTLGWI